MRIDEGGGLGAHLDASEHVASLDLHGVVLQPEGELEVVDELQGIDPDLRRAALVAEEGGAAAHHVEEAAAVGRGAKLEAARGQGEAGNHGGILRLHPRRECEQHTGQRGAS